VGMADAGGASPVHIAGAEATLRAVGPRHHACSPAWDGVQDQSDHQEIRCFASTAACQRGAVVHGDRRSDRARLVGNMALRLASSVVAGEVAGGAMSGPEHGSTLASSVVAGVREVISATVATVAARRRLYSGPFHFLDLEEQDAYPKALHGRACPNAACAGI